MKKITRTSPLHPSSLRLHPSYLRSTLRLSPSHFQLTDQAPCDCAVCPRCYVRHLPLSRQHALALLADVKLWPAPRSQPRSLRPTLPNFPRRRCARGATIRAHRLRPEPSTLREHLPSPGRGYVDRCLGPPYRARLTRADDQSAVRP